MKPFDLELAAQGKPLITRNGYDVRLLCFDRSDACHPIVCLIKESDGNERIATYPITGRYYNVQEHNDDLFMQPREGWVIFLTNNTVSQIPIDGTIFMSYEVAEYYANQSYKTVPHSIVKITWEN